MKPNIKALPTALAEALRYQAARPLIIQSGEAALQRLVEVANSGTGQSRIIGAFLLGLYSGQDYPFDLTELRALDLSLFRDCLDVLELDYQPEMEVHMRVADGPAIWNRLVQQWAEGVLP
jgi:hypothetical protein